MNKNIDALVISQERIHGPDVVRGLAAMGVVFFHVLYLSGIPIHEMSSYVVGRFDFFVRIFFILSAFSIANAYYHRIDNLNSLTNFYLKRFFRIAPLFYFLICIGLLYRISSNLSFPSLFDILLSISFLFPFIPGKHDSLVGGGWSIGVEWIFYAIFPLMLSLIKGWRSALFSWLILCSIAVLGRSYFNQIFDGELRVYGLLYFLSHAHYFVIGLLLLHIYKSPNFKSYSKHRNGIFFLLSIFLIILYFQNTQIQSLIPEEIFLSISGFVLVYLSLVGFPKWLDNGFTRWFGLISYSIYLIQFPVIQLLNVFGFYQFIIASSGEGLLTYIYASLVTLILVLLASVFTYRYIEVPGQKRFNTK